MPAPGGFLAGSVNHRLTMLAPKKIQSKIWFENTVCKKYRLPKATN